MGYEFLLVFKVRIANAMKDGVEIIVIKKINVSDMTVFMVERVRSMVKEMRSVIVRVNGVGSVVIYICLVKMFHVTVGGVR